MYSLAALFEQGIRLNQHQASHMQTFESNILYSLRFMIDCDIKGGQWVHLPKQSYMVEKQKKLTHCQLELRAHYSKLQSHAPEGLSCPIKADQAKSLPSSPALQMLSVPQGQQQHAEHQ